MARGRMINNRICADVAVNNLSCDTSRLAFTWLITFADSEGRTYGDPAMVRSLLFPRRYDVSVEAMASYIAEWAEQGLIVWYEAEGDRWIWFPSFEKNQRGLDRRKEGKSIIPAPVLTTEAAHAEYVPDAPQVRTEYVPSTAQQNRTEDNRTEAKYVPGTGDTSLGHDEATIQRCLSLWLAGSKKQPENKDLGRLIEVMNKYGEESTLYAFEEALKHDGMAWAYINKVLQNHAAETVPKPPSPSKPLPDVIVTEDWTTGAIHETRLRNGTDNGGPTAA